MRKYANNSIYKVFPGIHISFVHIIFVLYVNFYKFTNSISEGGDKIWVGFYTSRPTLKLLSRYANSILQIVKQIDARNIKYVLLLGSFMSASFVYPIFSIFKHALAL